jgi:hypothetical protein
MSSAVTVVAVASFTGITEDMVDSSDTYWSFKVFSNGRVATAEWLKLSLELVLHFKIGQAIIMQQIFRILTVCVFIESLVFNGYQ